jgi:catechol 2,3-dioxygenase-like lactoylglutathione lyase family enzyme
MDGLPELKLHHVSLMVTDAERSAAFYTDILGLKQLERPAFKSKGAWLTTGHLQVHLVQYKPDAPPPPQRVPAPDDMHFGMNTADFEGFVSRLQSRGYSEAAPANDPKRIMIRRDGPAGFPQVYLLDPDCNIIEVNGAQS